MYNAIIAFFSGGIDSPIPQLVLLVLSAIGTAAVAWGIIREAEKAWSITTLLVVGGVAIESICTFLLFGFDQGIIGKLDERIAPRVITSSERAQIIQSLKGLAKPHFAFVLMPGPETTPFMFAISRTLSAAGWTWVPNIETPGIAYSINGTSPKVVTVPFIEGLRIAIRDTDAAKLREPSVAFKDALETSAHIKSSVSVFTDSPPGIVEIFVGAKP